MRREFALEARRAPERRQPTAPEQRVLGLQRKIGNRAVVQLLSRLRHYDDDADLPAVKHVYDDDADLPVPPAAKPGPAKPGPVAAAPPKGKDKYQLRSIVPFYKKQDLDASKNAQFAMERVDVAFAKLGPGGDKAAYIRDRLGWTQEEFERYYVNKEAHRVTYMGQKARRAYRVRIDKGVLRNGVSDEPADTGAMSSKFAGPGYGIFVLSPLGRLYVGQAKMGVIHHSSFLAGRDVAGAGEMKIVNGQLKEITNKSGHYEPDYDHLRQTLKRLRRGGVAVDNIPVTYMDAAEDVHHGVGSEILKLSQWEFMKAHP
jgi:hypothetical protein